MTSDKNPCYLENVEDPVNQRCVLNRSENIDLTDIILNRWNVTCHCSKSGFIWVSKYGICVDIDECIAGTHHCALDKEVCLNIPGSYKCTCNWGYIWNQVGGQCEETAARKALKKEREYRKKIKKKKKINVSVVKLVYEQLFLKSLSHILRLDVSLLLLFVLKLY